jgi:hypothetical protein
MSHSRMSSEQTSVTASFVCVGTFINTTSRSPR